MQDVTNEVLGDNRNWFKICYFRLILCDIQVAYNTLLYTTDTVSTLELGKEADNTFCDVKYSVKQAETTFILNICALSELANTKSNVIGVSV